VLRKEHSDGRTEVASDGGYVTHDSYNHDGSHCQRLSLAMDFRSASVRGLLWISSESTAIESAGEAAGGPLWRQRRHGRAGPRPAGP
jgi:hypothetical protein